MTDSEFGEDNPYKSPPAQARFPGPPITDEVVRQLIEGTRIEALATYDVSDVQLFGRWHRRQLTGTLAAEAETVNCSPEVFQSVLWFCLVFVPVLPLGTYFVMPYADPDDPADGAERYRMIRAKWDYAQVTLHSTLTLALFTVLGIAAFYVFWL